MYKIATLNKISPVGLKQLPGNYMLVEETEKADGILVRSQDMHEMELGEKLKAVARAGAGVNNIPLDKFAEKGIVVFNTPGANANAVKELVICGLFLAARNIPQALTWASELKEDLSLPDTKFSERRSALSVWAQSDARSLPQPRRSAWKSSATIRIMFPAAKESAFIRI